MNAGSLCLGFAHDNVSDSGDSSQAPKLTFKTSRGKMKLPFHSALTSGCSPSTSTNFIRVQSDVSFQGDKRKVFRDTVNASELLIVLGFGPFSMEAGVLATDTSARGAVLGRRLTG